VIHEPEKWPPVPLVQLELVTAGDGYNVRHNQEPPVHEHDDPTTGLVTYTFPTEVVRVRRADLDKLSFNVAKQKMVSNSGVYMLRSFKP